MARDKIFYVCSDTFYVKKEELEKGLYEIGYERGHRPEWVRIPLRGITHVIERGRTES